MHTSLALLSHSLHLPARQGVLASVEHAVEDAVMPAAYRCVAT